MRIYLTPGTKKPDHEWSCSLALKRKQFSCSRSSGMIGEVVVGVAGFGPRQRPPTQDGHTGHARRGGARDDRGRATRERALVLGGS